MEEDEKNDFPSSFYIEKREINDNFSSFMAPPLEKVESNQQN